MKRYIVAYEQSYLNDIIQIWNEQLIYDTIYKRRFSERILLDENFDSQYFLVAKEDAEIVGFVYGVKRQMPYLERGLEEKRAWINMIAVKHDHQSKGIASELVQELEKRFKLVGVEEITLCAYSPNYFTPGIDKRYEKGLRFFESQNYLLQGEAVSMKCDLWNYHMSEEVVSRIKELEKEGIWIKPYEDAYFSKLIAFASQEFGAGWKRNVLMAMQRGLAEETIFLTVDKEDEIQGFVMRKIDGNDARFGPIGVAQQQRSKGLGSILLETIMNDMRKREIYGMYFLWTSGSAQRFYARHGFEVCRTYQLYKKVI